jgi:preprotein translocase subunit SecD
MLDFPRWKAVAIAVMIVVLTLVAIPSFLPDSTIAGTPLTRAPRINLGLDLAGGSYLLLEADVDDFAANELETKRDQVAAEMRRGQPRISIGDISTRGGAISFMLRDPAQVDAARERLLSVTGGGAGFTGQREWDIEVRDGSRFVVTPTRAGLVQAVDNAMDDATEVVRRRIDELGTREPTILRQGSNRIVVQVPGLEDPAALKALLGRTARLEFKLVDDTATPEQLARGEAPIGSEILRSQETGGPIAVKRSAIVSGDQLLDARQGFAPDTNQPIVNFSFDGPGGRRFARTTQENVGKPFAIIVDDQVISAPRINTPILGGAGYIEGSFTVESANQLAIALRSGKLPVDLKVVEERSVGPDLGADSIRAGVIACVIAALLVMGFMIVTYGGFGLFACVGLILNVIGIVALMALFDATLTLPGLAGFVLTVGAAVDANVLINERIREELRRGRKLLDALGHGFTEASTAIFDANVTNVIAGALMFWFGSGPIRGFAVVLMIGIITSYFTSVTVVRLMVSRWFRRTRPRELEL